MYIEYKKKITVSCVIENNINFTTIYRLKQHIKIYLVHLITNFSIIVNHEYGTQKHISPCKQFRWNTG